MKTPRIEEARREYDAVYPSYCLFTEKVEILIKDLLYLNNIKYHFIESRTKSSGSFIEKINRPGKTYSNPIDTLPDISGIRAVVYYLDDIDKIENIIRNEFDVREKELTHQSQEYDPDRFGYLSVHYIASLNMGRSSFPEWNAYKDFHFEIQIRTVLQHSWAAISHALQYKRESDVPSKLQRRLFRLAGLFELADDEFLALRDSRKSIEDEARESIKEGDSYVEINSVTVSEFISGWDRMNEIRNQVKKYGYVLELDYPEHYEEYGLFESLSSLVHHLKRIEIRTIKELEKILDYDPIPFLKTINEIRRSRNSEEEIIQWIVTDEFIILLMLIRSKIDKFNVKILMESDGWHKEVAERVILEAQSDARKKR